MEFNPNAARSLRQAAEPLLFGVLAGFGLFKGIDLLWRGAWFGVVPLILGAIAALVAIAAAQKLLVAWRSGKGGPGIVLIDEERISYFGPDGGAVLVIDDLVCVDIIRANTGSGTVATYWMLGDLYGTSLLIPSTAERAEDLVDALGTLPGFDRMSVVVAMAATKLGRFAIWVRA